MNVKVGPKCFMRPAIPTKLDCNITTTPFTHSGIHSLHPFWYSLPSPILVFTPFTHSGIHSLHPFWYSLPSPILVFTPFTHSGIHFLHPFWYSLPSPILVFTSFTHSGIHSLHPFWYSLPSPILPSNICDRIHRKPISFTFIAAVACLYKPNSDNQKSIFM